MPLIPVRVERESPPMRVPFHDSAKRLSAQWSLHNSYTPALLGASAGVAP